MAKILKKISETEFHFDGNHYEVTYVSEPNPLEPMIVSLINNGSGINIQTSPNLKSTRNLFRDGVKLAISVSYDPFLKNIISSMSSEVGLNFNKTLIEDIKNTYRLSYPEEYI